MARQDSDRAPSRRNPILINAATGDVTFVVGNQIGTRDDQACTALT
jgi:hypothetical protein